MNCYLEAAKPSDLNHVRRIARQWTNEVGYIPDEAYRYYIGLGSLVVAKLEGNVTAFLCGTFAVRRTPALAQIYQLAVDRDYLNRGMGSQLLRTFEKVCNKQHAKALLANVAENLPSLRWWMHNEFDNYKFRGNKNERNRRVCMMVKLFDAHALEDPLCRPTVFSAGGDNRIQHLINLPSEGADLD